MKKVLVVGGAGYIGSHATLTLASQGINVVVFDSLEVGHPESIEIIQSKYPGMVTLVTGNTCSKEDIENLFHQHQDIDSVIHFAAYSLVGESMEKPEKYYENNVYGSLNLLNGMVKHGVNKIVFSSTAAAYGNPKTIPITEDSPKEPINSYGHSKLMMERMLEDFYQAHQIRSIRLRYFNVAGADPSGIIGEAHKTETHLIPLMLQVAQGLRPKAMIFGDDYQTRDGTCVRDYIHVSDLIDAHLLALKKLETEDITTPINLGVQNGYTVKEIIAACKKVTGIDFTVEVAPRRPGDPDILVADCTKAKEYLGWEAKYNIEDMVAHAWNWHQKHPHGYDK